MRPRIVTSKIGPISSYYLCPGVLKVECLRLNVGFDVPPWFVHSQRKGKVLEPVIISNWEYSTGT